MNMFSVYYYDVNFEQYDRQIMDYKIMESISYYHHIQMNNDKFDSIVNEIKQKVKKEVGKESFHTSVVLFNNYMLEAGFLQKPNTSVCF